MPELPEIANLTRQIHERLPGKQIVDIEVAQPRCLNLPEEAFKAALIGARIGPAHYRGKWIVIHTDRGWLLLNLGMGGEILLVTRASLPAKRRLIFDFSDNTCLSVNFWWFGYAHYAPEDGLEQHPLLGKLGPNALALSEEAFIQRMNGARGRVKDFLLDQSKIAGIGNAYIHDILWLAGLHPLRKIDTLTLPDLQRLYRAIQDGLRPSLELGGAFYEVDLDGKKGGFTFERVIVGYREGQPCPRCGTSIQKIKTGSTSSFICPACQV
ncbi:MAG TPA: formamidopyrimidine-DNA glycosylase [Anaerolinea thermolimosa]|uniref:Formamidopyrimidine-DNA glycosylase n=1 Tax=Anaerolinea thermolimosa TaxID=229919 RepID=A0A3D1JGE2_9CHLR|nr:DNA-formamidopyrimidine glycosylase family protein [Anaerolinea thermolimosa]GAP08276.1 formamidopyrimidine-DNA glycosylase [Anaerolinea thermolimosa]HCE17307.1 formamidopyrimidine-DNA glycosylase [Anaerolinea thermolimosa]